MGNYKQTIIYPASLHNHTQSQMRTLFVFALIALVSMTYGFNLGGFTTIDNGNGSIEDSNSIQSMMIQGAVDECMIELGDEDIEEAMEGLEGEEGEEGGEFFYDSYTLESIDKVESQVVNGMNYQITFSALHNGRIEQILCEAYFAPGTYQGQVSSVKVLNH